MKLITNIIRIRLKCMGTIKNGAIVGMRPSIMLSTIPPDEEQEVMTGSQ